MEKELSDGGKPAPVPFRKPRAGGSDRPALAPPRDWARSKKARPISSKRCPFRPTPKRHGTNGPYGVLLASESDLAPASPKRTARAQLHATGSPGTRARPAGPGHASPASLVQSPSRSDGDLPFCLFAAGNTALPASGSGQGQVITHSRLDVIITRPQIEHRKHMLTRGPN